MKLFKYFLGFGEIEESWIDFGLLERSKGTRPDTESFKWFIVIKHFPKDYELLVVTIMALILDYNLFLIREFFHHKVFESDMLWPAINIAYVFNFLMGCFP